MATHKVKSNVTAKLWDKPDLEGRMQKGELRAGTEVTVVAYVRLDTEYSQLSTAHNNYWTKTQWLEPLPYPPPPPPPSSEEYILYVKDGVERKFIPE